MRVLHVLHHSLPQLTGYAIRSHRILTFQAEIGLDVTAVTSARDDAAGEAGRGRDEFDGITYHRTPAAGGLLADTRATARRVCELARRLAPDIIHSHSPWLCALAGLVAARRTGAPLVYEIRDFWEEASVAIGKFGRRSPQYIAARAVDGFLIRRAQRVVTISEAQRRHLVERGVPPDRIAIAGNGVDTDRFSPRPQPMELLRRYGLERNPVVGYIGSFLPYEGLGVLIPAFSRVLSACPAARLMIVGGGEEAEALQRLAETAGVAPAVIFTGKVPHGEIVDYYAAMEVLVYPRLSNPTTRMTTPLKPLEAMAMAKAVVASDLPAIREIVRPGETGLLCAAGDEQSLAECCLELLGEPALAARIGAAARRSMVETRTWRRTLAAYPAVYAELVGVVPAPAGGKTGSRA